MRDLDRTTSSLVGPVIPASRPWLGYALGVAIPVATAVARWELSSVIGATAPLLPFLLAVAFVAVLAGARAGVVAMIVSLASATLIADMQVSAPLTWPWFTHCLMFSACCVFVIAVTHRAQRALVEKDDLLRRVQDREARAREADEQTRLIADSLPALVAYIDRTHRYRFNNRAYEEWFGIRAADATGQHARDVLGEEAYLRLLPRLSQALSGQRVDFELTVPYHRGGARHIQAHYVPHVSSQGEVLGLIALIEDATERKRARDDLERARQSLSLALRAGRSGTFEWNVRDDRMMASAELLALFGMRESDFGGTQQAWMASVHSEDRVATDAAVARSLEQGELAIEYRILRKDDRSVRWMHCRGKVDFDDDGQPARMLGINVDITERVVAEEALRQAARRKDEFLAMLSHELRNPLAPIRSAAHLLAQTTGQEPDQLRHLGGVIARQTEALARLVDDLLDVARITRGVVELHRTVQDVHRALDAALETVQPQLEQKRQSIRVQRAEQALLVDADEVRLSQVFANILGNASKFSDEDAVIDVAIEHEPDRISVRIRDEGRGIDADFLPQVFELFQQGERTLARTDGGLGIGLNIAQHLIRLHGGDIEAHSAGTGQGSEFIVRLPRVRGEAGDEQEGAEPAAFSSRQMRVLVVDDNVAAASMLAMCLELEGWSIETVETGQAAIASFDRQPATIVILDIGLPDISGYEVATALRQRQHAPLHIIAITGYGRAEDVAKAHAHGVDVHLTKPVDPAHVIELIGRTLSA